MINYLNTSYALAQISKCNDNFYDLNYKKRKSLKFLTKLPWYTQSIVIVPFVWRGCLLCFYLAFYSFNENTVKFPFNEIFA